MGIRKPRQVIFPAYTSVLLGPVAFRVQGSSGMCDFQLGRTFNRDSSVEVVLSPQNIGSRIFLSKRDFQGASASTRIKHIALVSGHYVEGNSFVESISEELGVLESIVSNPC